MKTLLAILCLTANLSAFAQTSIELLNKLNPEKTYTIIIGEDHQQDLLKVFKVRANAFDDREFIQVQSPEELAPELALVKNCKAYLLKSKNNLSLCLDDFLVNHPEKVMDFIVAEYLLLKISNAKTKKEDLDYILSHEELLPMYLADVPEQVEQDITYTVVSKIQGNESKIDHLKINAAKDNRQLLVFADSSDIPKQIIKFDGCDIYSFNLKRGLKICVSDVLKSIENENNSRVMRKTRGEYKLKFDFIVSELTQVLFSDYFINSGKFEKLYKKIE